MRTITALYLAKFVAYAAIIAWVSLMYGTLVVLEWLGLDDSLGGPIIGSMGIALFVIVPVVWIKTVRRARVSRPGERVSVSVSE